MMRTAVYVGSGFILGTTAAVLLVSAFNIESPYPVIIGMVAGFAGTQAGFIASGFYR